jgi:cell wall-associated NlpC family hydrolase
VPTLTAAQIAQLVKQAGFPQSVHVTMVAIALAESGGRVEVVSPFNSNGTKDFGLFQINSVHHYNERDLVNDAAFNTRCAKAIYDKQGLRAWSVYTNGKYEARMNEARQGVAQAASVTGNASVPSSGTVGQDTSKPSVTYGPPGPQIVVAGVGTPLTAAEETTAPLRDLRIMGTSMQGDFAASVIGVTSFTSGIETIPNVTFTVADPEGELLYQASNLWQIGVSVQYQDLWLRIDDITFEAGSHGTGQIVVSCIDDIVYALQNLRGPRTANGISATEWLAQELSLAGIDPNKYFLGESVPTQSVIARDEADQSGQGGQGQAPSAWTTGIRLARELGKRIFVSGQRLVFGSSAFAMQWSSSGTLRLTRHSTALTVGEHWLGMPTARVVSIGNRSNVLEVAGRVPLSRAKFFRPGVSVDVTNTPAVAAGPPAKLMCSSVAFDIGTDTSGADITLLEPIDPPAQPPTDTTSAGANGGNTSNGQSVSGGGADGQIGRFVALCLQQAGKSYVYGATPSASEPNPRAFDCSSLVQWAAIRCGIPDPTRTTYTQEAKIRGAGRIISVQQAINTKGALLFQPGHVAISLGNGKTIEAMNSSQGVRQGNAAGRGFTAGGLLVGAQGY